MTKQEWLGIMSLADDQYIEEADPANYKRKIKLSWKKITAIAASICVFAVALFSGIYFPNVNRQSVPEGISGGLVSSGGGGEPQMLSPYFCGYKFEKNIYDKDNITFKYYYAVDEFIFNKCFNDDIVRMQKEHGEIVDYRVYVILGNYEVVKNYLVETNRYYPTVLGQENEYDKLLLEIGTGETANGIYVHDILKIDDNFSFDKYAIDIHHEGKKIIWEYSYSETVTIPEELIVGDTGKLYVSMNEVITFADGIVLSFCSRSAPGSLVYKVNGNQVRISQKLTN